MQNRLLALWNAHIILESLPISSSGHITLLNNLIAKIRKEKPLAISNTIDHLMHIPTALIIALVILLYGLTLSTDGSSHFAHYSFSEQALSWLFAAIIADSITGFFYLIKEKTATLNFPIWLGFLVTSIFLLSLYALAYSGLTNTITIKNAVYIGFSQSIALLPGVSRMATTTVTALWLGIAPLASIIFSLFLELGLIIAALAQILLKESVSREQFPLKKLLPTSSLNVILSTAFSILLLVCVIKSVESGYFMWFGWYMLFISCIALQLS